MKRSRVNPVNRDRKQREFQRAYGSPERVSWVQKQACCVCGDVPSENAHTATGGMGRKADAETIAPLCNNHHRLLHQMGVKSFQGWYGVDLAEEAALTQALWDKENRDD